MANVKMLTVVVTVVGMLSQSTTVLARRPTILQEPIESFDAPKEKRSSLMFLQGLLEKRRVKFCVKSSMSDQSHLAGGYPDRSSQYLQDLKKYFKKECTKVCRQDPNAWTGSKGAFQKPMHGWRKTAKPKPLDVDPFASYTTSYNDIMDNPMYVQVEASPKKAEVVWDDEAQQAVFAGVRRSRGS